MNATLSLFFSWLLTGTTPTPSLTPLTPQQQNDQDQAVTLFDRGDYAGAVPIFTALAAIGDARSEADLGYIYYCGCAGHTDRARALSLQKLSAAQGYPKGEWRLGEMYRDAGDPFAQSDYGWMFSQGQGVPKDYSQALHFLNLAAAQGESSSMCGIGALYQYGHGVPRDYHTAMDWFMRSAHKLADISKNVTAAQKSAAQAQAQTWLAAHPPLGQDQPATQTS